HLQNVVIAEAMLRQVKVTPITRQESMEIAKLCDASLSVLYEHDWAAFQQYWQWLREINPNFIPRHSTKLRLMSLVMGYESAEAFAHAQRWIKSSPTKALSWVSGIVSRRRGSLADRTRSDTSLRDVSLVSATSGYRFAGTAALLLGVGTAVVAGMMALGDP